MIKIVEEIKLARKIGFFGMGVSLLVTENWYTQFLHAQTLTEDGTAIVISYSVKTEEMSKCAIKVKLREAKLVLISIFFKTNFKDLHIFIYMLLQLIMCRQRINDIKNCSNEFDRYYICSICK